MSYASDEIGVDQMAQTVSQRVNRLERMTKRLLLLIIGIASVVSWTFALDLPTSFLNYLKTQKYSLIAMDIKSSRKGMTEFLVLCGKNDLSPIFFNEISLFTVDRNGNYIIYPNIVEGGYEPILVKYIFKTGKIYMVKSFSMGSGGYIFFTLFKFKGMNIQRLTDDETVLKDFKISGNFEKGFAAVVYVNGRKLYRIDLKDKKDFYIKNGVYDSKGNFLLRDDSLMPNGISDFELLKNDVFMISTSISGAWHYDRLADLYIYLKLDKGKLKIIDIDVAKSIAF